MTGNGSYDSLVKRERKGSELALQVEFYRKGVDNFMPMMVVDDNEFDIELARLQVDGSKIVNIERGRGHKKNVDPNIRAEIAAKAIIGIDPADIRKEYNISSSSISAYKNGVTSTANYNGEKDKDLNKSNNNTKNQISELAEQKILESLGLLNTDKLRDCKPRELVNVTKELSAVVKNMAPDVVAAQSNQVIIFKPRMREEDEYEVIDIAN